VPIIALVGIIVKTTVLLVDEEMVNGIDKAAPVVASTKEYESSGKSEQEVVEVNVPTFTVQVYVV
jgi:hypothetical protein